MLEFHPLANLFPLLEGKEFDDLVQSIRDNGLINPIMLCDGKILDGRNRYRACLAAGVEPEFDVMSWTDPDKWMSYVAATNLQRRHLTDQQRVVIAAKLVKGGTMPRADAASTMSVNPKLLERALVVERNASAEVIDMMTRGEISVARALDVTRGDIPIEEARRDNRRAPPTKRVGNHKLNAMRGRLKALLALKPDIETIVAKWQGRPEDNADLAEALRMLNQIAKRTREIDGASAVA
jgi:ParB-like chromosome segregation protein Spo0J